MARTAARAAPEGQGQRRRPLDAYQRRGQDSERAATHLLKGDCRCKRQCHRQVPLAELTAVRTHFWEQTADLRAHLLRSLYEAALAEGRCLDVQDEGSSSSESEVASSRRTRVQWNLCGVPVCRQNFACLLGTKSRSLTKAIKGVVDGR